MTDIAPGVFLAGRAGTTLFDGIFVVRKLGVLQIERASPSKRGTIACQPGRQYAIEHIHSARDHLVHCVPAALFDGARDTPASTERLQRCAHRTVISILRAA